MKHLFYLLIILTFFTSCKPTSSIITSKEEALKLGVYNAPKNTKIAKTDPKNKSAPKEKKEKKKKNKKAEKSNNAIVHTEIESSLIDKLITSITENIGTPYRVGGTTKEGFDCSGLLYATFKDFDISLPRSSNDMSKTGTLVSTDDIQKGDFIFFITNGRNEINHVGMVIEVTEDDVQFIHATTSSGVIISSIKEDYYSRTFTQANRIL